MKVRDLGIMVLTAVVTLTAAFLLYEALVHAMDFLWQAEEGALWPDGPPAWFVLLLPTVAGGLVYLLRSRVANGHSPLDGLELTPLSGHDYLGVVGAIIVTMVSGVALGPEASLLATGGFIGGFVAHRFNLPEHRMVVWAGLWAIGGLFLGPLVSGNLNVGSGYSFQAIDLLVAVGGALVGTAVLTLSRLLSLQLNRIQVGGAPVLWLLLLAGASIGALALAYRSASGDTVALAMTSGEQMIQPLLALGTVSAIGLAVAAKAVIYGISMGSGFRGGAYFPALFVGAGSGAMLALQFDASVQAGAAAGLVASVTYLSQAKWVAVVILGVAIGLLAGGLALLPVCLVAAGIGRLIPRVDPHAAASEESDSVEELGRS